jgi:hypothetical protein
VKHRQAISAAVAALPAAACYFLLLRLGNLSLYVVETIALCLLAGIFYFIALHVLERRPDSPLTPWVIFAAAILFRALLLPLELTLSEDVYRYRWEARIQQEGVNPYSQPPSDPGLARLRDSDWRRTPGRDVPTLYPPLAELAFRAAYSVLPGLLAFKLEAVLADIIIILLLAWWVRRTGGRSSLLALYAWNPLVVVEFAASGHFDSLATSALLAACLLIIRGRQTVSTLLVTAAALIKLYPVVLLPLWLRRAGWPRAPRSWLNLAAAAALVSLCWWPFRDALWNLPAVLGYFQSRWVANNSSLFSLLYWFSGSLHFAAGIGVGAVAALAVWLAWRREDVVRAAYMLIALILLFSQNAFSWYFTWLLPFLCFFPHPAWLLLSILQFLSYHVLIDYQASGLWRFQPFYLWLAYGPFFALLALRPLLPQAWSAAGGGREAM